MSLFLAQTTAAMPAARWRAYCLALCLMLLAPLLLTDVPPLLDYPNHLARLTVLAANGTDPVLARFYAPRWDIIPDLAIDAIGPLLLWVLPVHVAGRIVLGVAVLLPVFGTLAYSRTVLGQRTLWPFGCALVAWNGALLQGFLNYSIGIGVALLLAAGWLRWREPVPTRALLVAIPGAVVLFFCHLMALLFFALLIAAHDILYLWRLRRYPAALAVSAVQRLLCSVAVFALPVTLYAVSDLRAEGGDTVYLAPTAKAAQLLTPFANYWLPLDIATAVLVAVGMIAAALTKHLRVPPRAGIALGLLGLLYLAAPFGFKGTFALDTRFVVLAGFLLFGGMAPVALPSWIGRIAGFGIAALLVVRMTVLGAAWWGHNADIADFRTVTASVRPGETVFVTTVTPAEAPEYWDRGPLARRLSNGLRTDSHLPALLVVEHRAWWPFLFDNPSQQPVETREPYRDLALRVGGMPPHHALEVPGRIDLCGFGRVLLLEAGAEPNLPSYAGDRLRLVVAADAAALFDVRLDPACPATTR